MMHRPDYNERRIFGICIVIFIAIVFAIVLSGCNTVKGLAQDIHDVAEGIQTEMSDSSQKID